ncbi:hypothetical protein CTB90_04277 [Dickeya solani]|nr:hypothetical protein CTB90_04277 [Dickeya solani]
MLIQQLARRPEVTDVGHARADEHFIDFIALHRGQQTRIVRVVRRAQDRLPDVRQIDVDHRGVFRIGVGFQQLRVRQPFFHALHTTLQRAAIAVAFGNHPLQQDDVGVQVLDDRLFVELDGTARRGALRRGIGQFERLLRFQVRQPFDFQDAAGEDVFLALLLHGQQTLFDRVVRDRVHQIAQRDTRLHLAGETHQHRFRHIQRHHAGGGGKRHQTGAGREGNPDRETGVRIAAGADGIRQQHAVQPGVDHAVARTQRHPAAVHDEIRQGVVGVDVHRLRIGGGVAEGLHHQIGGEAQTGQVFQFVTGHRTGGVLRPDRRHLRLAVGAGANAGDAAGTADHLLRQREAAAARRHVFGLAEHPAVRQAERLARFGGQAAADNQRDTAAGAHFIQQHVGFQFKTGQQFVAVVVAYFTLVRVDINHVAHVQPGDIHLDRQRAGVFHGVEENRRDLAAQYHAAAALVRHVRDIVAHEPQHRVGGGFTGRAGADHVADVGQREPFPVQRLDLPDRADGAGLIRLDAVAGVFQHRQRVQRNVRTRPGVLRRGQVIGIGFAGDLEHGDGNFFRQRRAGQEPLGVSPGFDHLLRVGIAGVGLFFHVVEIVEHQQGMR